MTVLCLFKIMKTIKNNIIKQKNKRTINSRSPAAKSL